MKDDKQPPLIVIAGPNASGKSTITKRLKLRPDFPSIYINVDEMMEYEGLSDEKAWEKADRLRADALENREPLAFETVLSNTDKIDFMKEAKKAGYCVSLYFICLQDPEMNVLRAQERCQDGKQSYITEDIVRDLYPKSIQTLSIALPVADEAMIYNNSWENPELIARKTKDGKIHTYPLKEKDERSIWTKQKIEELIGVESSQDES